MIKLLILSLICVGGAFAQVSNRQDFQNGPTPNVGMSQIVETDRWNVYKYHDPAAVCYIVESSTNKTVAPTISCVPNIIPEPLELEPVGPTGPAGPTGEDKSPAANNVVKLFDWEGHLGAVRKE
jgi:hypothetical protein